MTASDIVSQVKITDVAQVLGVKMDRTRRRGVATWREGTNFSVSFSDEKNVWHDFVTDEGGGVLDFIQRARGCDRKEALQLLASIAGVPLDHHTEAERRDYARRMHAAKREAEALLKWKAETLEDLRFHCGRIQRTYHNAVKFVLSHDAEECERRGDVRYELALQIGETYWDRVEAMDEQIDRLEAMSPAELLKRFRGAA
jgi:DNA primase